MAHNGFCPADLAGYGTALPDGGVDTNDLIFFLQAFEVGSIVADLDYNGGVDIEDLLAFMKYFESGC